MSDISQVANLLPTVNEGFSTTLGTTITAGASTVPLNSVNNLTNASVFVGIIEVGTDKQQTFTGTVDTGTSRIIGVKWTRGDNVPHTGGVSIVDYVTGTAINMLSKAIQLQHKQNGTHGNVTADSLVVAGSLVANGSVSGIGPDKMSNPYKFSVWLNGAQAVPATTFTKVNFNAELFDTSNNFDATTNFRFIAPVSGYYQFNAVAGSNTTRCFVSLYKNNVELHRGSDIDTATISGTAGTRKSQISALVQMNANDYVELWAYANNAGNIYGGGTYDTWMTGHLVSTT